MEQKIIDFVNKYIKTKVDYDNAFGAQCVDLFRQYVKEVLEIPEHTGAVVGAKDLYEKYEDLPVEKKHFIRLDAKRHNYAKTGDIAVWGQTSSNIYGHVAIVLDDMNNYLLIFEQDGLKQDGAKLKIRSKENLLGYLTKYDG